MTTRAELGQRLGKLKNDRLELKKVAIEQGEGWRRPYFEKRAAIAEEIRSIKEAVEHLTASKQDANHGELLEAMSAYATAASRHQGEWPIVLIEKNPGAFQASLNSLDPLVDRLIAAAARLS